jgi:hypothetical protein
MSTNQTGLLLPKIARSNGTVNRDQVISQKRTPGVAISNQIGTLKPPVVRTPGVAIIDKIGTPKPPVVITPTIVAPKTPLVIPRIGTVNNKIKRCDILQIDDDPWLPPKTEGSTDIKIAGITPIGTISTVPTNDKRPPQTPRTIAQTPRTIAQTPSRRLTLNVIDQRTGSTRIDPLLTTAIYLDCTKRDDQDYHHVANKMRSITANTLTIQKHYITDLKPIPNIVGRVSHSMFEKALSIYENNQVYYQDRIDDHNLDVETIKSKLTELEHWFMCIIEPKSRDDIQSWKERELIKLTRGVSEYCDPELYIYITPLGEEKKKYIKEQHKGLL